MIIKFREQGMLSPLRTAHPREMVVHVDGNALLIIEEQSPGVVIVTMAGEPGFSERVRNSGLSTSPIPEVTRA